MLKTNKKKLLLASVLILLPVLFGLLLPGNVKSPWGNAGGPESVIFFILPAILLAVFWLCVYFTGKDTGNQNQNPKVFGMVMWTMPILSIFVCGMMYFVLLGKEFDVVKLMVLLFGLLFLILGNYMPKCTRNYTIGIRVKWTLESQENWNATHRFAGKVFFFGGLAVLMSIFLPEKAIVAVLIPVLLLLVLAPMIYSYLFYKKQLQQGIQPDKKMPPVSKNAKATTAIALPLIAILVIVLLFVGSVEHDLQDTYMTISATFNQKMTVDYDAVERMEYRESMEFGSRIMGFGSPKLSVGTFRNNEFGTYTLYANTGCKAAIVLEKDGSFLVINAENAEGTRALYEALLEKIPADKTK